MTALKGRVFERLAAFKGLSEEVQTQVSALIEYLGQDDVKATVVSIQPKKVTGTTTKTLQETVLARLGETNAAQANEEHAAKLVDALVLRGVFTPTKDADSTQVSGFAATSERLTAVGTPFVSPSTTSVWSVAEGAIQAGELKRKPHRGRLNIFHGLLSHNKPVYVVANEKTHTVSIFESDVATTAIDELDVSEASVQFDESLEHGVQLSNSIKTEVFGAASKEMAEEWLNSFINAGATYREAFNLANANVTSFHDLKDFDMDAKEVKMEQYKGKVVLVVNVSSECGLTPTNYPELVLLDQKYRDQGLVILAFPCNQFAGQEPGTHEEIKEFVKQYKCEFQFFEKADVNGAKARPVFTYLKHQLPGSFGNFVKWNFTKFLVDRNGKPFKRYAPKELPLSFEDDIKTLLAQTPEGNSASVDGTESNAAAVPKVAETSSEAIESKSNNAKNVEEKEAGTAAVAKVTEPSK